MRQQPHVSGQASPQPRLAGRARTAAAQADKSSELRAPALRGRRTGPGSGSALDPSLRRPCGVSAAAGAGQPDGPEPGRRYGARVGRRGHGRAGLRPFGGVRVRLACAEQARGGRLRCGMCTCWLRGLPHQELATRGLVQQSRGAPCCGRRCGRVLGLRIAIATGCTATAVRRHSLRGGTRQPLTPARPLPAATPAQP